MLSRRLFVGGSASTCAVLRLKDRKILHLDNAEIAARAVLPPASTVKPFSLLALIEGGKLRSSDGIVCSRRLTIAGHQLNCAHPPTAVPMNATRAIAYSCNQAVAHYATRYTIDELPRYFVQCGFTSQTGLVRTSEGTGVVARNTSAAECQLQALGEGGIRVTPLELLLAYARLAAKLRDPRYAAILQGLEGAVNFGTAQAAQVKDVQVAGKTGSILLPSGAPAAWFAGFAPGRAPRIAVVVLTQGRSGGADAAPIAGRLLQKYLGPS